MEEDSTEQQPTGTTSLFAAFVPPQGLPSDVNNGAAASAAEQWLQNPSFTTDISVINDAVCKYNIDDSHPVEEKEEEEDEVRAEEIKLNERRPQYELLPSSPSNGSASSDDVNRMKRKRKKKKRRVESGHARSSYDYATTLSSSRKSGVQKWASSSTSNDKEYYFDSRGDPDNLAFGSIYRMDVARYKLRNSERVPEQRYFRGSKKVGFLDGDADIDALDKKLRSGGRYWSARYAAVERHKNLKRMRILAPSKAAKSFFFADFIPLSEEGSDIGQLSTAAVVEESWEDEVLRKTKEFNKMTRECPQDEGIWMAFSEFQDKVASMQAHRGARLQTLEKKISILEKATELNPESEDLLIALMNACRRRDSVETLIKRWEKILTGNSGSCKLWREFLCVVKGEFSRFKISDMRKAYANAIQALAGACTKLHRQVSTFDNATSVDSDTIQLELGLVDIFLGLCRLEWQAGYQELATALLQAEIEYCLFCPLGLSEQSKRRLFEHFWTSNGARIGEDGALGWSTWLEKEEEQRQRILNEEESKRVEEGGWTGWFDPLSISKDSDIPENTAESNLVVDESNAGFDDVEQKDDIESLLKALGIDVAAEADSKIKDAKTWTKWSKAEIARDLDEWLPARANLNDGTADPEDDELLSIVLFEDVSDYLFSLNSEEARLSLAAQFIDFYDGRISQWSSTNSPSWVAKTISLETLPYSILEHIRGVHGVVSRKCASATVTSLELMLNSDDTNMKTNMMKFLRNAILLFMKPFPQNYILEGAALVAEELSNTRMNSTSCSITPCRALAKTLLKNNRQDVFLCGVYAQREAFFGNIDHSRKIFDMALSSIDALPLDIQPSASLLYFWYAEMELGHNLSENSDSSARAMHILCCLGSGARYSSYKGQPSNLQQLRARQGFQERMKVLSQMWARGVVDDHSAALLCSAASFEELTSGCASALEILEHSFTMVLPERRRQSRQLEFCFNYYVRMLCKHRQKLGISKVWEAIVKGLQIYPFNSQLHKALVEISHLHSSPNKLRCTFDEYCIKKSSIITWIYALSFEMSIGGSQHRIRGLFERALEDEKLHHSVLLWRCYIEYERTIACNIPAAKRVFFRALHACPWSKKLWLEGFLKLDSVLTVKELSDLQEVMQDKELNMRTDIYEILLQDESDT